MKSTILFRKLLCTLALLVCFISFSNPVNVGNPYWEGEILLSDGTVKKGFVEVIKHEKQSKVNFKASLKAKEEEIDRKTIEAAHLISPSGKKYTYEKVSPTSTITGTKGYGSILALVSGRNGYATTYITSENYVVDSKTNEIILYYRYNPSTDFMLTKYFIKKRGSDVAKLVYMTGHLGGIKKGVNEHLSEAKELVKRVNDGEFDSNDMQEILQLYLKETEGM